MRNLAYPDPDYDFDEGVRLLGQWLGRHYPLPSGDCLCGWTQKDGYVHRDHLAALLILQHPWEQTR